MRRSSAAKGSTATRAGKGHAEHGLIESARWQSEKCRRERSRLGQGVRDDSRAPRTVIGRPAAEADTDRLGRHAIVAKASLATTPMPDRSGVTDKGHWSRTPVATARGEADSVRPELACRQRSQRPAVAAPSIMTHGRKQCIRRASVIQRVASAIVTGDAITVAVRTDDANSQPERTSGATTYAIRSPQPMHLASPATCQVRSVRAPQMAEGRRSEESVRVVLDDRDAKRRATAEIANPPRCEIVCVWD